MNAQGEEVVKVMAAAFFGGQWESLSAPERRLAMEAGGRMLTAFLTLARERGWKVTEAEPNVADASADKVTSFEIVHELLPLAPWMEEKDG